MKFCKQILELQSELDNANKKLNEFLQSQANSLAELYSQTNKLIENQLKNMQAKNILSSIPEYFVAYDKEGNKKLILPMQNLNKISEENVSKIEPRYSRDTMISWVNDMYNKIEELNNEE
jgi:hypothetical protein